ncbi:MAG TPA: GNAT family N-acetyltransferase [Chloroflexi bacterium]|nr:GNAT family N-acetyltransferase [Chloroflexota bacterium]
MVGIRNLQESDIQPIAAAFAELGWDKPPAQYRRYFNEQQAGLRVVLVSTLAGIFAGYVTIVWASGYAPFLEERIPEIVDFNVLPVFRRQGIGTLLLDEAERHIAERSAIAGIGVGLTPDYGAAQIMYVQRGYIPDGRGLTWGDKRCQHGDRVIVDDGLALYFTKTLEQTRCEHG